MFVIKLQNGTTLKYASLVSKYRKFARNLSNTETLEPVKLSYATYENTSTKDAQPPPLIIMHGLFGSKGNWNSLCKVYNQKSEPQRKIIAIDARNHGDSDHHEHHTYAHLAADIKALLERLNVEKVALMGHSMGGRAVMLFALKYPELVDRLIVSDISPVSTSPNLNSTPALFQALESVNLPSNMPMSQARALVDSRLSATISDKLLRSFLLTNLTERDDGSYKWRVNIPVLIANFNSIARFPLINDLQYSGPVLFVGGGNSDFIQSKSLQRTYPLQNGDGVDLSYASYELTRSHSKNDPKPVPLVILHGFMGSKGNWNSFCKRYHESSSNNKVFALDIRNHGDSPHSKEHSYENLVLDIRQFLNKMDIQKAHLLGHSIGGRAVMLFALKYPELVEKLIVVDMSPITTSSTFKKMPVLLKALKKLELPRDMPLSEVRKIVSQNLRPLLKNESVTSFLLTNLVQNSDGSYGWRFNTNALLENFESIASFPEMHHVTFEGPTLFVGGAKSDFIQKSDYPKILKLFPNAELRFIEGAGHWLHSEKPAEFLKITLEFLNKRVTVDV